MSVVKFQDVKEGEIFLRYEERNVPASATIYMKVAPSEEGLNAVDLETGDLWRFGLPRYVWIVGSYRRPSPSSDLKLEEIADSEGFQVETEKKIGYNDKGPTLEVTHRVQLKYSDLKTFELPKSCSGCPVGFHQYECGRELPMGYDGRRPSTCRLKKVDY